jgi:Polysaccharide biosynthesis enzyme WcbI
MSIYAATLRATRAAQATYDLWRCEAGHRRKSTRPLCLVYGNCQAEPIRALLAGSSVFAESYDAVRVPAVHEIGRSHVARLQRVLRAASVVVAQPIKDGYRGLPLGTEEIVALAPRSCTVIRFQALHYDALYPFQFNLRGEHLLDISAPLTAYHDLRALCAAAKGLTVDAGVSWVREYIPATAELRAAAEQAEALIRERERMTDISIAGSIVSPPRAHTPSFFTVNHPSRFVLQRTARAIHDILGLDWRGDTSDSEGAREPLGKYRTPVERPIVDALGLDCEPTSDWIIKGRRVSAAHVARRHISWYRRRPDLVRAALGTHAERIAAFRML